MLHFDEFLVYCGKSLLNLKLTLNELMMKKLNIILFLILFSANINAQNPFLKKMQQRLESKIENKVLQKTDKTVDKALDAPFNTSTQSTSKSSVKDLPAEYKFSWKYDIEMMTQKSKPMMMTYFLQPNANYQGMVMGDIKSDMFMVMDFDKEMMLTLMEAGGSKMGQAMSMPKEDFADAEEQLGDYEITSLPNQVIAGYNCKGLQMKNKEYLIKYYFTNDVPLTLNGMNKGKENAKLAKILNGINVKDPGLMMKMDMTDLKNKKNSMTMECKSLAKSAKIISRKDYKFM